MADDAAARMYIQEAVELIANRDFDRAAKKLELADVELDDLKGDEKAAVAALIKDTQASIVAAKSSEHRPRYLRMLNNLLDEAESDIGNLVTWPTSERKTNELYADVNATASIADELATALPKFNTFKKLHARKAASAITQQIESDVQGAEEQWNSVKEDFDDDSPPSPNDYGVEKSRRYVEDARKRLAQLPADNEAAVAVSARLDAIMAEIDTVAMGAQVGEMMAQLGRQSDLYENEWGGWHEETDEPPSWDDYRKNNTDAMKAFGAPRTRKFRERITGFFEHLENDAKYHEVSNAPTIKAFITDIQDGLDIATSNLLERIQSIVPAALSAPVEQVTHYERLERDIARTLGEDHPEAVALTAKVRAKIAAHEQGVAYEEQAGADQVEMMFAKAEEVWPSLYAGLSWASEIDLTQAGQQIGFLADNLMGYRFSLGAYYYATTIGGVPVAAKIDAKMMAGIKAVEEMLGRSIGDDDRDGKWDVVAQITDKKATLQARKQAESTGNIGSVNVSVTHDYSEPVEAVVIEFLAAKCGAFAGSKANGVLKTDGTVEK